MSSVNLRSLDLLSAVLAPCFIAASIIAVKLTSAADPLLVAGLAPLISVPFLALWSLLRKESLTKVPFSQGKLRTAFINLLITRGVLGQILIVLGFSQTSAVKSVLLLRLEPVCVLVWSVLLLHEHPSKWKVLIVLLLLVGSALVVTPTSDLSAPNRGDFLIVISLLLLSYSYIPTQELMTAANPLSVSLWTNFLSGIIIALLAIFLNPNSLSQLNATSLCYISAYSLTFFVFGATLYFFAFRSVAPWIIASLLSLEVVVGLLLAAIVFGEIPSMLQGIGAAIVLAATFASAKRTKH